jgi:hypothetical protein
MLIGSSSSTHKQQSVKSIKTGSRARASRMGRLVRNFARSEHMANLQLHRLGAILAVGAAGAFVVSVTPARACLYDTDCAPASKCVKPSGRVVGMCTGGRFPGNQYDGNPYTDPFDPNRTAGKTCSFNLECGPGNHCAIGLGIYGVCTRP